METELTQIAEALNRIAAAMEKRNELFELPPRVDIIYGPQGTEITLPRPANSGTPVISSQTGRPGEDTPEEKS